MGFFHCHLWGWLLILDYGFQPVNLWPHYPCVFSTADRVGHRSGPCQSSHSSIPQAGFCVVYSQIASELMRPTANTHIQAPLPRKKFYVSTIFTTQSGNVSLQTKFIIYIGKGDRKVDLIQLSFLSYSITSWEVNADTVLVLGTQCCITQTDILLQGTSQANGIRAKLLPSFLLSIFLSGYHLYKFQVQDYRIIDSRRQKGNIHLAQCLSPLSHCLNPIFNTPVK